MHIHPAIQPGAVAVVTGAAHGIGRATAERLGALGMQVALIDRDADALAAVADGMGPVATSFPTDVSDAEAMADLAGRVARDLGPVGLLMNNAGVGGGGDAISNPEGWSRVLGVNLLGVLNGVQSFVPAMVAGDRPGLVINTGSKQGITQPPGDTAYNVSKAGVKALTEGLAHTLRQQAGERLTAHLLIPGFTYTGMIARHIPTRPPGAWTSDQVAERLFAGIRNGEFYILCQDNETTREQDEKRILWSALDIVEGRPALSRWHPAFKERFDAFMDPAHDIPSFTAHHIAKGEARDD